MHVKHFMCCNILYKHFLGSEMTTFNSVEELIRVARDGRSQKEFAELLKVDQSLVSKYERGKANPPISFINQCMHLVHRVGDDDVPTADQLAEQIRAALADPDLRQARFALSRLVDAFASENAQTRVAGATHR